jgi:hypothetical protein
MGPAIDLGHQSQPKLGGVSVPRLDLCVGNARLRGAPFTWRGDRRRTNIAEIELCKDAGIDIAKDKGPNARKAARDGRVEWLRVAGLRNLAGPQKTILVTASW